MKIKIGKPVKKEIHTNEFKIEICFMYGDGDGAGSETVYVKKDNPYLERFIKFLHRCENAFPNGRGGGGRDEYDDIEDYWLFNEYGANNTDKLSE